MMLVGDRALDVTRTTDVRGVNINRAIADIIIFTEPYRGRGRICNK